MRGCSASSWGTLIYRGVSEGHRATCSSSSCMASRHCWRVEGGIRDTWWVVSGFQDECLLRQVSSFFPSLAAVEMCGSRAILIYGQPYAPVPYGRFPINLTVDLRHHQDHSVPGASSGSSLLLMSVTSPHPALVPLPSHHSSGSPHVTLSGSPLQLNNILFYRNIFICYKSYTNTNIN